MNKDNILARLKSLEKDYGNNMFFSSKIKKLIKEVEEVEPFIVVVGQFSVGKSEFINALLGERILISHSNETTKVITKIKKSQEEKMLIKFIDGRQIEKEINRNLISEYSTFQGKDSNSIKEIEIHKDINILDGKISIVDSPGLNSLSEEAQETTNYLLKYASAVIYLFNCEKGLDKQDDNLLEKLFESNTNILLVGNRKDLVSPISLNEVLESVKINTIKYGIKVIEPVSSKQALDGYISNDGNKLSSSNIKNVKKIIRDYVNGNTGQADQLKKILVAIKSLERQIEKFKAKKIEQKNIEYNKLNQLKELTKIQYEELFEIGKSFINQRKNLLDETFKKYQSYIKDINKTQSNVAMRSINKVIKEIKKNEGSMGDFVNVSNKLADVDDELLKNFKVWEKEVNVLTTHLKQKVETIVENDETLLRNILKKEGEHINVQWPQFETVAFELDGLEVKDKYYSDIETYNQKIEDLTESKNKLMYSLENKLEQCKRELNELKNVMKQLNKNRISIHASSSNVPKYKEKVVRKFLFITSIESMDNHEEISQKQNEIKNQYEKNEKNILSVNKKMVDKEEEVSNILYQQRLVKLEFYEKKQELSHTYSRELVKLILGDKTSISKKLEENENQALNFWSVYEENVREQYYDYLTKYRENFEKLVTDNLKREIHEIEGEFNGEL